MWMSPEVCCIWPLITFSSVDLPAPFGPSSAITAPLGTREVDPAQHLDATVGGVDVDDLEDGDAHADPTTVGRTRVASTSSVRTCEPTAGSSA